MSYKQQTASFKPRRVIKMKQAETLVEAALRVLNAADPFEKARLGDSIASQWLNGTISEAYDPSLNLNVPDRPARLSNVCIASLHCNKNSKFSKESTCLIKSVYNE